MRLLKLFTTHLGNDAFSRFENPKISLHCHSYAWEFNVTKESETTVSKRVNHWITINPINRQIIEIYGFQDNEL